MHWSGVYQIFMVEKPMYFRYNANLNDWANPEVISKDTMNVGIDISLNNNNYPETVYRKTSTTATGVFTDSARYTKKEGFNWNFPELVSGTDKNQVGQQIAVDQNNDVHVLETEYYVSADLETQLVHYFQFGDNWIGQAIDSSDHMCHYPKLLYANNNLYVVYWWHSAELGEGHIRFSKYDIITNIKEEHRQTSELKIYPNPSQGHVTIQFYPSSITGNNKTNQAIRISVFDLNGNHVKNLANKVFPSEKQQVLWNGTNKNGKKVNSGLYLIQLKYGQNTFTQTVEIVY
jgi:hypothetical protein